MIKWGAYMKFSYYTAKADKLFEDIQKSESKFNTVKGEPIAYSENTAEIIMLDDFHPYMVAGEWAARLNAQQALNV